MSYTATEHGVKNVWKIYWTNRGRLLDSKE